MKIIIGILLIVLIMAIVMLLFLVSYLLWDEVVYDTYQKNKKRTIAMKQLEDEMERVCDETQTDNGIGCSRCESRFDCYDRNMPHAIHCNNYDKITDESQIERSNR